MNIIYKLYYNTTEVVGKKRRRARKKKKKKKTKKEQEGRNCKNDEGRIAQMAHQLRALTVLVKELSIFPIWQLISIRRSSSRGSNMLCCYLQVPVTHIVHL